MKLTKLEQEVIGRVLADPALQPVKPAVDFEKVIVKDREFTGTGFFTEFEPSQELKLFDSGVSMRWGKVGAKLNASKLDTGYLVYVDDGYVTTIEGYTYGEDWPHEVEELELYELMPGAE